MTHAYYLHRYAHTPTHLHILELSVPHRASFVRVTSRIPRIFPLRLLFFHCLFFFTFPSPAQHFGLSCCIHACTFGIVPCLPVPPHFFLYARSPVHLAYIIITASVSSPLSTSRRVRLHVPFHVHTYWTLHFSCNFSRHHPHPVVCILSLLFHRSYLPALPSHIPPPLLSSAPSTPSHLSLHFSCLACPHIALFRSAFVFSPVCVHPPLTPPLRVSRSAERNI